ncbi:MAG: hypothetical protein U1D30_06765 [Planctomycetota bacterium]
MCPSSIPRSVEIHSDWWANSRPPNRAGHNSPNLHDIYFISFLSMQTIHQGALIVRLADRWTLTYRRLQHGKRTTYVLSLYTMEQGVPVLRWRFQPGYLLPLFGDLVAAHHLLAERRHPLPEVDVPSIGQIVDPYGQYLIEFEQVARADGTLHDVVRLMDLPEFRRNGSVLLELDAKELGKFIKHCRGMLDAVLEYHQTPKGSALQRFWQALTGGKGAGPT